MPLSAAIGQVAEVLAQVEQDRQTVRDISLLNSTSDDDTITGEAKLCLPVLQDIETTDAVTIAVSDASLEDECVEVSLDITVEESPIEGGTDGSSNSVFGADHQEQQFVTSTADDPAYKDPEALRAVYDEFDTFPEMTRALGADVTSETVRRYMVKHDIHDPDESIETAVSDDSGNEESPDQVTGDENAADATVRVDDTEIDGSQTVIDEGDTETVESDADSDLDSRSITELLENAELGDGDSLIADGSGIPQSLTVDELATILERSRTVTEVTQELGLSYERTRRLLHGLGLIELVTGRLASSYTEVPSELVAQRLTEATDTT